MNRSKVIWGIICLAKKFIRPFINSPMPLVRNSVKMILKRSGNIDQEAGRMMASMKAMPFTFSSFCMA